MGFYFLTLFACHHSDYTEYQCYAQNHVEADKRDPELLQSGKPGIPGGAQILVGVEGWGLLGG